jgi:hypothetical protein
LEAYAFKKLPEGISGKDGKVREIAVDDLMRE